MDFCTACCAASCRTNSVLGFTVHACIDVIVACVGSGVANDERGQCVIASNV